MSDSKSGPATATVWTIAEAGARTWREARDMYVNGGLVTAHTYPDGVMSIFVGCALIFDGPIPAQMLPGSLEWFEFVRFTATVWGMERIATPVADPDQCQTHPEVIPEWDGYNYVCSACILADREEERINRDATMNEIMDYALSVAFPVGYYFAVRDETGSSMGAYPTVRQARDYINGWAEFNDASGLRIHPYQGNGREIMARSVKAVACGSTHVYMGHEAACVQDHGHAGQHADICGVRWGFNR